MSRSNAREDAFKLIYQLTATPPEDVLENYENSDAEEVSYFLPPKQKKYVYKVVMGVSEYMEQIDELISQSSHNWDIERISRVALSIIRLAVYEITHMDDIPTGVSINEALNLVKKYDAPEVTRLVNGILSNIVKLSEEYSAKERE